MTLRLHLADLLPPFAEFIVGQSTRNELVDLEREAIFQALLNSVRWSVIRRARAQLEPASITVLETSDHFADEWMSRAEIVARVYADVDRSLWPFAEWSVQAQLEYLAATGDLPPGVSY